MKHRLGFGYSGFSGFLLLGLVTLTGPATAVAHSVTFDFTGTFAAANPHSLGGIFTVPIASYSPSTISGTFTFNGETPDSNGSGTIGQYNGAIESLSFSVTKPITGDAYQFGLDLTGSSGRPVQNSITVNANSTAVNQSYVLSASVRNLLPNGPILDGINHNATAFFINLLKPSLSVFSTDVSPETPPVLAPFSLYNNLTNQDGQFRLVFANSGGDVTIIGNLTSMTVSAVPVPAAVYLFGTGIIGVAVLARRRVTRTSSDRIVS